MYNRAELGKFFEYLEERKQPALALYELYDRDSREVTANEFDSLFTLTSLYHSFQIGQSVLTEVISSGRLSLVQNDSLRFLLAGWAGLLDKAQMEDLLTHDYVESEIFRYSLDHVSWRNMDKFDEVMKAYVPRNSNLKDDNRSALESFEMENRIGQLIWYYENTKIQYIELAKQMDQIIEITERQLSHHDRPGK